MRLLVAAGIGLALGCGAPSPSSGPPEIRYGLDECTHCRMIIVEPRHAAVARSASGEEARFDDLLGVREHLAAADETWQVWVHGEDGWIPAAAAWYAHDPEEITPMGSGLLAFADRSAAARQAAEAGGEVMTWEQFLVSSEEPVGSEEL